jgi:hypothetical protein
MGFYSRLKKKSEIKKKHNTRQEANTVIFEYLEGF